MYDDLPLTLPILEYLCRGIGLIVAFVKDYSLKIVLLLLWLFLLPSCVITLPSIYVVIFAAQGSGVIFKDVCFF